jgi:putative acetyltransferase
MDGGVRGERPDDLAGIRDVNRLAFGREDEAQLVDALRAGGHVCPSLVADEGGRVA